MSNIQFLRGTEAKNNTHVGPEGSITVDMTNWRIRLHDGLAAGGFAMARLDDIAVKSVAGKTGAVTLSTTDIAEGTNLYFTNARAKSGIETLGLDFGTL